MTRTYIPTHNKLEVDWKIVNAEGKILGKVATEIADMLTGKNKPTFTPNINVGDKVVVINAEKVEFSGNKLQDKKYYWHTGYPGGIKSETLGKLFARKPTEVLKKAVSGMLPKNKLRKVRMSNLKIYEGTEHPHQAQLGGNK